MLAADWLNSTNMAGARDVLDGGVRWKRRGFWVESQAGGGEYKRRPHVEIDTLA